MKTFLKKLNEEFKNILDVEIDNQEQLDEDFSAFIQKAQIMFKSILAGAKIFAKKVGNKVFPFFKRGSTFGVLDVPSKKVAVKWAGAAPDTRTIYWNPSLYTPEGARIGSGVSEDIITELKTKEDIARETSSIINKIGADIQDVEEPGDDAMNDIGTAKVDFDDLALIFKEMAVGLRMRKNFDSPPPRILIAGPPGAGKTTAAKAFAKKEGYNLKILEVASVYKELIGGFPVVEAVLKPGSDEYLRLEKIQRKKESKEKLDEEEESFFQEFVKQYKEQTVRLKETSALPPNKGAGNWMMFLDEYNRDEDKQNAAMNLVLAGHIGTEYYLPLKTIVVVGGNVGGDFDGTNVASMDSAMWDRFSRKVLLSYDWLGWIKYSNTEDEELNMGPTPSVLKNFVARTTQEKGVNDWVIKLKQFNPDDPAQLTPRTLSDLAHNMKIAALTDWEEGKLQGDHDKQWYEERYEEKGFPSAAAYYLHVNQLKKKFLARVADQMMGPHAADQIVKLITDFNQTKSEFKAFSPEEVLYKWSHIRGDKADMVKKNMQFANQFVLRVPDMLSNYKTEAELKKVLKSAGAFEGDEKLTKIAQTDPVRWIGVNIHNFFVDTELGLDTATAVAKSINELRHVKDENDSSSDVVENKVLDTLIAFLIKKSDKFSEAWKVVGQATASALGKDQGTADFKQAVRAANKGELVSGDPIPNYITKYLNGKDLTRWLFITNAAMLEPGIEKKIQSMKSAAPEEKQEKKVEEALKTLFKKLV